jgi:DNA-binding transcriptional ArsR family regulator
MPKVDLTNTDLYEKLEEIRKLINTQLNLFKLVNEKSIETARKEILALSVRKKIFDLCDNKKTVTEITRTVFPSEHLEKSAPKVSYHLAVLEDCGLIGHRDEKGQRYYCKSRE